MSKSYFFAANSIPEYNSSIASRENRLEIATETVICFALAFIAYISDILTITAL